MKEYEKIHDPNKKPLKDLFKKIWHFIWEEESIASYVVFIILAFVFLRFVLFPGFLLVTGYSDIAAVVSSSMEHDALTNHTFYTWLKYNGFNMSEVEKWPYLDGLNVGDVVVVKKVSPEEIKVGDIVLFYNKKGQIIHRVVFIEKKGDNYYYTTKGDANPSILDIEKDIPYEKIKGKLVRRIPYIGWPKVLFSYLIPI
ncbi:MAG: signal peptidase I [Nanoarchaeota archaeon]|nr:signal peptidase I [Nanoarchaeota archaeon]